MTNELSTMERNLKHMVDLALAALPDEHRQRRIDYCRTHNQHGCRIQCDWETGAFSIDWGGECLISGRITSLFAEVLPEGELVTFDGDVPDTVAELLGDES